MSASDGSSAITTTNQGEAAPATDKSASKDTAKTSDSQEDEKKRTEKDKRNTSNFDFDEIEALKNAPRSVRTAIMDYAVNAYYRAMLKVPAFQFGIPEEKQERMTFEKFRDEFNDDAGIFAKGTEKYLPAVYEYINKQLDAKTQEKAEGKKEDKTDSQGNPINEDGTLKVEQIGSIDELTDEDFTTPTRNVQLPTLSENVANAISTEGKAVVIKKNIFEKNKRDHKDLTAEQSREILKSALYNPQLYGQNQKAKRPYNWVVINTKDEAGHNRLVLLEVNNNKDNVEIVHWHYVDQRGVEKIKRQAEREDGQLLILPSDSSEEVGALSDPTQDLPSEGKDSKSGAEKQGKGKKNERKKRKTKSDLIDELGQPANVREWIMRSLYRREYKFIWDSNGKTKELGQHLGLADSKAERKNHFWMLAGKDKGGMYPESVAEAMTEQINDDLGLTGEARVNSIDVLNELLDVVGSYSSQSRLFDAIFDIHKGIEDGISDEEAEYLGNESLAKSWGFDSFAEYEQYRDAVEQLAGMNELSEDEYTELQSLYYDCYYGQENDGRVQEGNDVLSGEQTDSKENGNRGGSEQRGNAENGSSLSDNIQTNEGNWAK